MDSLSKYLAQSGFCSRRNAVELIKQLKVSVNGVTITEPGYKLPERAIVKVGNKVIRPPEKLYILLNKPKGYVTTVSDEFGRKTVMDLLYDAPKVRLYPVGRLDQDTTGLLLLTNDGELAQKLAHPRYEVQKTYIATLDKPFESEDLFKVQEGITLKDGKVDVDIIEYIHHRTPEKIKITLHSGKNRVVRRIFAQLGYHVLKLDRVEYAGLTKKGLPLSRWRYLTKQELAKLKK